MERTNKLTYALAVLVVGAIMLITSIAGGGANYARAAVSVPSNVLEDLGKDKNFNVEAYPVDDKDYSLKVIQIAENTDGELLIYVYQPCARVKELRASSINIAREPDKAVDLKFINYGLNFLNSTGVFYKYSVQGLNVDFGAAIRYYNISNILRPYDSDIDDPPSEGQTVSEVPAPVAQFWTAITTDGKTSYYKETAKEVLIKDKYVGFMRYTEGYWLQKDACDAHYIAFSTDYDIKTLYDADVKYSSRYCHHGHANMTNKDTYSYTDNPDKTIRLKDVDTGHTTITGIGGIKHTWSRIESVTDFIEKEDLTAETKEALKNKQWVLRFTETDYTKHPRLSMGATVGYNEYYTEVSEVIILRLHFKTTTEELNLGVVDNKQTGDRVPDNPQNPFPGLKDTDDCMPWWVWLLIAVGVVAVVLILICIFVPGAAPAIGRGMLLIGKGIIFGIYYLFYGLFWLISAPFRLIADVIKNRKAKPKKPANKSRAKNKTRKKAGKKK